MERGTKQAREWEREYAWWMADIVQSNVEDNAKATGNRYERWGKVPGETEYQYTDEHNRVFEVSINVEFLGMGD